MHPVPSDSLSQQGIIGIAQATDQFLWIATSAEVARFDGIEFESFRWQDLVNRSKDAIRRLLASADGGMWVAFDSGGVAHLGTEGIRMITEGLPALAPEGMFESEDRILWLAFPNGQLFTIKNGQVTNVGEFGAHRREEFFAVAKAKDGHVWFNIGAKAGVIAEGKRSSPVIQLPDRASRLIAAREDGVWICSGAELFHSDGAGNLQKLGVLDTEQNPSPTCMLEDRHGNVWIGSSYCGLFCYDGQRFENIPTSHRRVISLAEDHEGNIWVGTPAGLNRIQSRIVHLLGSDTALPLQSIHSLCEDSAGVLWGATQSGVLVFWDDGGWNKNSEQPGRAIAVAADPVRGIWIGGTNRKISRWRDGVMQSWGLEAQTVRRVLASRSGDVWLAMEGPHCLLRFRKGEFTRINLPDSVHGIAVLAEDQRGSIWVGAAGGALFCIKDDVVTDESHLVPAKIECLYPAPDGAIWIGYDRQGLGRLKDGQFRQIHMADGLSEERIAQMVPDKRGWLWFRGNHGVFSVPQAELDGFADGHSTRVQSVHFGAGWTSQEMQLYPAVAHGGLMAHDGTIWMPMGTAIALIEPKNAHSDFPAPRVLVQKVSADGQSLARYGGPLPLEKETDLRYSQKVQLPAAHRDLQFQFTALTFAAPQNVQFRYRLEGFDKNWIEAGTQRQASYPQLPAGDYQFRVSGRNSVGMWSDSGEVVHVSVDSFVWRTWWFQIASLMGFTSCVAVAVRHVSFRRLRTGMRRLRQESTVNRERARIARDLHDDLGSRLNRIALLSELTLQRGGSPADATERTQQIAEAARQVIKSLDETVWAINPRNDTLSDLIDYVSEFAVEFLQAAGIQCWVEFPTIPERMVPADVRHHLFLAIKEGVNNVARHSAASEVWLKVTATEAALCIEIEDNGKGFAKAPENALADGLRNMRQRMKEIGGSFSIDSTPGSHTRISLIVPWKTMEMD